MSSVERDVLQRCKNRNDFVPTIHVQCDIPDRLTAESSLLFKRLSHPCHSSKMNA